MDNQFEPVQSQSIWTIILPTIIITALIVGGGIWWWQRSVFETEKETLQQQIDELEDQISELSQATEEIGSNQFADWKTYRNEKYGFEIKYPESLSIKEFNSVHNEGVDISFPSGSTLVYSIGPYYDVAGDKSIVLIDGENYDMWCQPFENGETCRILLDIKKEIEFANLDSISDFNLFKQILSTFKFTN